MLHPAERGCHVKFVTIDNMMALEVAYHERVIYRKRFAQNRIEIVTGNQLIRVGSAGNRLVAVFRHELSGEESELPASQVVIEHGTVPVDGLYHALRAGSVNDGVTDVGALLDDRS